MRPRARTGALCAVVAALPSPAFANPTAFGPEVYVIGAIFVAVYMVPTFIAFRREHPNRWVIFLLNMFLGTTGIVWFGCIIWALMGVHRTNDPAGSHGGESGLNIVANDVVRIQFEPSSAVPPPLPAPVAPTITQPHEPDVLDRLERLKRLHDAGAVDDDQFRRMRDAIVASAG